jgi:microcystin-dependent protein
MAAPYVGEIIQVGFNFAPQGYAFCDGQLMPISENETLFLIGTTYGGDGETTFALPDLRGRTPIGTGQGPGLANNYQLGETGGSETTTITVGQMPAHTHTIDSSGLTATVRVRNGGANQTSPVGNVFAGDTSPALAPVSDVVRTAHITDLRSRIDAYRAGLGLAPFAYTDPALTAAATTIRAVHITELRTALQQAYAQAGLTPPVYTDPTLTPGVTMVKASHVNEIRTALNTVTTAPRTYSNAVADANMNATAIVLAAGSMPSAGGNMPHENRQPYLAINYCISLFGVFPPMS